MYTDFFPFFMCTNYWVIQGLWIGLICGLMAQNVSLFLVTRSQDWTTVGLSPDGNEIGLSMIGQANKFQGLTMSSSNQMYIAVQNSRFWVRNKLEFLGWLLKDGQVAIWLVVVSEFKQVREDSMTV